MSTDTKRDIDLYLVRHAESCSNLLDNKITDTFDDTDNGKWQKYHEKIKKMTLYHQSTKR
jgi:hypothetical protein